MNGSAAIAPRPRVPAWGLGLALSAALAVLALGAGLSGPALRGLAAASAAVAVLAGIGLGLRLQARQLEAERERFETEVSQRTAQLTELAQHLQTAREDERQRLARDLHDELGALLTSAKLDAARIRSRLAGSSPEALERLAHLVQTLDAVIAVKRRIAEDLRPSALVHLGLMATIEILAREYAERSGVNVQCALGPVRLTPAAELTVYRLLQEAITNISKHAQARQVWITLAARAGQVEVSVRDDGVGFDPAQPVRSAYGLVGMRYRAAAEGGQLAVDSAPGQGTVVRAMLPQAPD
jgi:signal transduction histidine kinase